MKDINKIVKTAITSLLTVTTVATFNNAISAPKDNMEKCYGIVKTAMNDCQTATQSCAGSSTKDKQPDAFIFLPKGACNKISGGNLTPQPEDKTK